jgi:hypothetical protein
VEALVGVGVGLVEARRNESKEPGPGLLPLTSNTVIE